MAFYTAQEVYADKSRLGHLIEYALPWNPQQVGILVEPGCKPVVVWKGSPEHEYMLELERVKNVAVSHAAEPEPAVDLDAEVEPLPNLDAMVWPDIKAMAKKMKVVVGKRTRSDVQRDIYAALLAAK